MSSQNLISILMPAYNAEKFINEAIQSILNQNHDNWELLILDDASTDKTSTIIRSFSDERIRLFGNKKNEGYLRSCNRLFELAKGDFITFLDADDKCDNTRLSTCLKQFKSEPELGFLTTDHTKFDSNKSSIIHQEVDYDLYRNEPEYAPIICCATIFIRLEILQEIGGYDTFFERLGGEDYHWLYKLSRAGNGMHLNKALYQYRQHPEQIHLQNENPLKYFTLDIIEEIRKADLKEYDLLSDRKSLLNRWNQYLQENPAFLSLRMAGEALNSSDKSPFWKHWRTSIVSKPHSPFKFRESIYMLYSYFTRIA